MSDANYRLLEDDHSPPRVTPRASSPRAPSPHASPSSPRASSPASPASPRASPFSSSPPRGPPPPPPPTTSSSSSSSSAGDEDRPPRSDPVPITAHPSSSSSRVARVESKEELDFGKSPQSELNILSLPKARKAHADEAGEDKGEEDSPRSSAQGGRPRFASLTAEGGLSKEFDELHQRLVVLRVITFVLVLMVLFILVVFSFGKVWVLVPCSALVIAVVGWVGAIRAHRGMINFLWIGLAVWTFVFSAGVIIFTAVTRFHSSAVNRCSGNMQFALSYARSPSECTKKEFSACVATCIEEVSKHLSIEAVVLVLLVAPVLGLLTHIARGVALTLPAQLITFEASDSEDDDEEEEEGEEGFSEKKKKEMSGKLKQA